MAFTVRKATREEIDRVFDWAVEEGWNPGLNDPEVFYRLDPEGFFVGELDGQLVGSVSAIAYNRRFGFMGLYIVRRQYRGQGYGVDLWDTGMLHLRGRNIGLACPLAQQSYYGDIAFRTAFRSTRYEGIGGGPKPDGLTDLRAVPIEKLADYDARRFPARREAFLAQWIHQPGATALGMVRGGRIAGYGVLRPCRRGHKVGPLIAGTPAVAERILAALVAAVPSQSIYLDVPAPNAEAVALAKNLRMHAVLETAWMFSAGMPRLDLAKTFGMTSRGLG